MNASIRSFTLVGLLLSACSSAPLVADRSTPSPSPSQTLSDPDPYVRPTPNVAASKIRLVKQHPAEADAVPEVRPRRPLHLVVDGCDELELFDVPSTSHDPERQTLALEWSDPGTNNRARSLTILLDDPGCQEHPGVQNLLNP